MHIYYYFLWTNDEKKTANANNGRGKKWSENKSECTHDADIRTHSGRKTENKRRVKAMDAHIKCILTEKQEADMKIGQMVVASLARAKIDREERVEREKKNTHNNEPVKSFSIQQ